VKMQTQKFTNATKIQHMGMVPIVAYLIIKGQLEIKDRKGNEDKVLPGEMIGLKEVWHHQPLDFDIDTTPGTTLLPLDKSTLARFKEVLAEF